MKIRPSDSVKVSEMALSPIERFSTYASIKLELNQLPGLSKYYLRREYEFAVRRSDFDCPYFLTSYKRIARVIAR